jgi:hypothetical protein
VPASNQPGGESTQTRATTGFTCPALVAVPAVAAQRAGPVHPGPCCNNPFVRDPEGALIRAHDGITGVGDLDPAVYDCPEPAARITITRAPYAPENARPDDRSREWPG